MKKKKRSDKSQLNQDINPGIGLFDQEPKATPAGASKQKGEKMNTAYLQATRIRKRILNFHRASQKGRPFIQKQSHSFKKGIILLAMNNNLLDEDFIQSFQILTLNRRLYDRATGLVTDMSDSPHFDLIFMYAVEKIFQAIRSNDLLILGAADSRVKFTEKIHKYGKQMMLIKQLNDCLDFVCKYMSSTGLARTDDRSRKEDLKDAYSMYLYLIESEDYKELIKIDEFNIKGLLFICVSLFITHERITAQIVDELMDYGAAHYKAMVPDPRIFYKVAKKTKKATPGSTRLTFLETYIYQVLEVQKLPEV